MGKRLTFITFEKIEEQKARVISENYRYEDFTEQQKEELHELGGYPVYLPEEPLIEKNKIAVLYTNPKTKDVWYEIEDISGFVDTNERVSQLIEENLRLKQSQEEQDELIMKLMLGGM